MVLKATSAARRRGRRGTAALEFALTAMPFFALVLAVAEAGFDFYVQEVMDFATQYAARQAQIGAMQASPLTPAAFVAKSYCTAMGTMLPCTNVTVTMKVVTDYWNVTEGQIPVKNGKFDNTGLTLCPGTAGQLILMQAYYPLPKVLTLWMTLSSVIYNGHASHVLTSTAAFMDEQFPPTGTKPAGC